MPAFLDDLIFPVAISRGSTGGPDWFAEIVPLASGAEERNTPWAEPLNLYDLRWAVRSKPEQHQILSVYRVAHGPLYGFRLLDWLDYQTCDPGGTPTATDQALGTGDGATTVFELNRTYSYGGYANSRRVHKPYDASVAVDGVPTGSGLTVDMETGTVTFDTAPGLGVALTWGGEYHIPVRFDGNLSQMVLQGERNEIPSILLKELRVL